MCVCMCVCVNKEGEDSHQVSHFQQTVLFDQSCHWTVEENVSQACFVLFVLVESDW